MNYEEWFKMAQFDEVERERRVHSDFMASIAARTHRDSGDDADVKASEQTTREVTSAEKRARESAEWDRWADDKISAALEKFADFLGEFVGETQKEERKRVDEQLGELRAELTTLRSIVKGEVAPLIRKVADDAAA
jgi:hypothetical protein